MSETADWRLARPDAASADAGAGLREEGSFAVEATAIGAQSLIPGVAPIGLADRLAWRAAQPLAPAKPQRPCDCGLFDLNARDQLELFAREEGRR